MNDIIDRKDALIHLMLTRFVGHLITRETV
jgi:hypothetical protein